MAWQHIIELIERILSLVTISLPTSPSLLFGHVYFIWPGPSIILWSSPFILYCQEQKLVQRQGGEGGYGCTLRKN